MGFFKTMIRKYDPVNQILKAAGVDLFKKKKPKAKSDQEKTREKIAADKANQDLTIGQR